MTKDDIIPRHTPGQAPEAERELTPEERKAQRQARIRQAVRAAYASAKRLKAKRS